MGSAPRTHGAQPGCGRDQFHRRRLRSSLRYRLRFPQSNSTIDRPRVPSATPVLDDRLSNTARCPHRSTQHYRPSLDKSGTWTAPVARRLASVNMAFTVWRPTFVPLDPQTGPHIDVSELGAGVPQQLDISISQASIGSGAGSRVKGFLAGRGAPGRARDPAAPDTARRCRAPSR